MKWRGRRGSDNIADIRSTGATPRRGVRRAGGIGGIGAILVLVLGAYLGVDLTPLLGMIEDGPAAEAPQRPDPNAIDDDTEGFVSVVLADTEEVWSRAFAARGARYEPPVLVLFSGAVQSACGAAGAAVGPFYCPGDRRVYLDTGFFDTLERRLGARGDFPRAYVIAHEVGHHVQNLMGVMDDTARLRPRLSARDANALSVRVELQADCLAGVWANGVDRLFGALEPGDIEEALDAAARIGDDALQRREGGQVVPDSFTHGTSEQRRRWFLIGYESGDMDRCDSFSAAAP